MTKNCFLTMLLTSIISCFALTSCGDDDDKDSGGSTDYAKMILGTWSDERHTNWAEEGSGDAYGFEFMENGVCYLHGSNYGRGRYQITDNILIISFQDHYDYETYTDTYTIKKLTKEILVIHDMRYDNYDDEADEEYYRVE